MEILVVLGLVVAVGFVLEALAIAYKGSFNLKGLLKGLGYAALVFAILWVGKR